MEPAQHQRENQDQRCGDRPVPGRHEREVQPFTHQATYTVPQSDDGHDRPPTGAPSPSSSTPRSRRTTATSPLDLELRPRGRFYRMKRDYRTPSSPSTICGYPPLRPRHRGPRPGDQSKRASTTSVTGSPRRSRDENTFQAWNCPAHLPIGPNTGWALTVDPAGSLSGGRPDRPEREYLEHDGLRPRPGLLRLHVGQQPER